MFPLKERVIAGYKHGAWTWYGVRHRGNDYRARYAPLYAPFDGKIIGTPWSAGGGRWVQFKDNSGRVHHFAHMSSAKPVGSYKRGQMIGVTGNSGTLTTNAHLHYHISKDGKIIDPETIYKQGGLTMSQYTELKNRIEDVLRYSKGVLKYAEDLRKDTSKIQHKLIEKDIRPKIAGNSTRIIALQNAIKGIQKARELPITQFDTDTVGILQWIANIFKSIIGR